MGDFIRIKGDIKYYVDMYPYTKKGCVSIIENLNALHDELNQIKETISEKEYESLISDIYSKIFSIKSEIHDFEKDEKLKVIDDIYCEARDYTFNGLQTNEDKKYDLNYLNTRYKYLIHIQQKNQKLIESLEKEFEEFSKYEQWLTAYNTCKSAMNLIDSARKDIEQLLIVNGVDPKAIEESINVNMEKTQNVIDKNSINGNIINQEYSEVSKIDEQKEL